MCGIAGVYNPSEFDRCQSELEDSLRRLAHRGPDASGRFASPDRRVLLGHTRLSIIDLSQGNNQPFCTDRTVTVFNGEVYNFPELKAELLALGAQFRSSGDTEVIAQGYEQWGDEVFRRLQGMYAIGIFDRRRGSLVLARDMFGIKPLYVWRQGEELRFASEIKALGEPRGRAIDERTLLDLLSLGYPLSPHSLWQDIEQVPPGGVWRLAVDDRHRLQVDRRVFKPLWTGPPSAPPSNADLHDLLSESVSAHLLADVPVAVSLSGGLDSSIVTALAAQQGAKLRAYTNTFDADNDFEVQYACLLTRELGLPHRLITSRVLDLEGWLAEAMWYLEEPLPNPALLNSFFVGKALREDDYKVVLIGEGSDELFAGYPWHRLAIERATRGDPKKLFAAYCGQRSSAAAVRPCLTEHARRAIDERRRAQDRIFRDTLAEAAGSRLAQMLHFDRRFQLVAAQLQRVDRMLMAHGIEARVPFLYDSLLAAAGNLPDERKLAAGGWWQRMLGRSGLRSDKLCLAEAMQGHLPAAIVSRKKWGQTGTTNLYKTSALEQLPELFGRMCSSADYAGCRELLDRWIDFDRLAEVKSRKTRLFTCQLLIALDYFVLGRKPQPHDEAYRIDVVDAHSPARARAA